MADETTTTSITVVPTIPTVKHSKDVQAYKLASRMMELLNDKSVPQALWWLKDEKTGGNDTFAVDPKFFQSQVLDPYFRGTKYASFLRTMHKMGFARLSRNFDLPKGVVAYSCDLFKPDEPDLMHQIRMNNSGKQAQAAKAARHAKTVQVPKKGTKESKEAKSIAKAAETDQNKGSKKAAPKGSPKSSEASPAGTSTSPPVALGSDEQMMLLLAARNNQAMAAMGGAPALPTQTTDSLLPGLLANATPAAMPRGPMLNASHNPFLRDQILVKMADQDRFHRLQQQTQSASASAWNQQFAASSFPPLPTPQQQQDTRALLAALNQQQQQHQQRRAAAEFSLLQNALLRNPTAANASGAANINPQWPSAAAATQPRQPQPGNHNSNTNSK